MHMQRHCKLRTVYNSADSDDDTINQSDCEKAIDSAHFFYLLCFAMQQQ